VAKTDLTGIFLAVTTDWYDSDGVKVKKSDPDGTTLRNSRIRLLVIR